MGDHVAVMPGADRLKPQSTMHPGADILALLALDAQNKPVVMSYRFYSRSWTAETARAWLAKHGVHPERFTTYDEPELFEHGWVQVFKAGTHVDGSGSKDSYSEADLDAIVEAFGATYPALHEPPLRLGQHEATESSTGERLPGQSAGWVGGLKREGEYLLAKLVDLPAEVYRAIQGRRYKKVSAGIAWNREINGIRYPKMLDHLALLGANIPAVKGLQSLQTTFLSEAASPAGVECRTYSWTPQTADNSEEDDMELEKQVKDLADSVQGLVKLFSEHVKPGEKTEPDPALAAAQAQVKAYEEREQKRAVDSAVQAVRDYCEARVKAKTMKPATRDALLTALETQRTYTAPADGKGDGTLSLPWPVVKTFADGLGASLDDSEKGKGGGADSGKGDKPAGVQLLEKARAYAETNKVALDVAVAAVREQNPDLVREYLQESNANAGGD